MRSKLITMAAWETSMDDAFAIEPTTYQEETDSIHAEWTDFPTNHTVQLNMGYFVSPITDPSWTTVSVDVTGFPPESVDDDQPDE